MNRDDLLCFGTMMVVIVVGLSVLGYNWYQHEYGDEGKEETKDYMEFKTVAWGDFVTVQYTGKLADTGEVFETTYEDVGEDDSIPKLEGVFKDGPYEPKKIYVGPSPIPGSPDNDVYTTWPTVPQGLVEGLVGMKKGETRTLTIPPEKAFTDYKYETLDLYYEVPTTEQITKSDFSTRYGSDPKVNMVVYDKDWNWPVLVLSISGDDVVIMNDPDMGGVYSYREYSWNSTVVSKNATTIVLKHDVSPDMEIEYKGFKGTVEWVDDGSFRLKYNTRNDARAGKTVVYEVTIVKILRKVK